MPATPTCQPWCNEHRTVEDECYTLRCIYSRDKDDDESAGPTADPGLAASMRLLGHFPDEIDTIFLEMCFSREEADRPSMLLKFWDSNTDEDSCTLDTDLVGLKELHSSLGLILGEMERRT